MRALSGVTLTMAAMLALSSVGCSRVGQLRAARNFKEANKAYQAQDYRRAVQLYEQALTAPVERFMKDVFVNDKNEAVRSNRHALLQSVHSLLATAFADLAEVSVGG